MRFQTNAPIVVGVLVCSGCGGGTSEPLPAKTLEGDLEPIPSALTRSPDYEVRLRQALLDRAPSHPPLQFLVAPSFEPESLLTMERVGEGYEAQVLRATHQVWLIEGDASDSQFTSTTKSIPVETAERLCRVWRQMLARTRYADTGPQVLDGVEYTFMRFERGVGFWGGESSNPEPGTRPYVLAEIGEAVVAYVLGDAASERDHLTKIYARIRELEASLPAR